MKDLIEMKEINKGLAIMIVGLAILLSLSMYYNAKSRNDTVASVKLLTERAHTVDALDDKILIYNEEVIKYNDNLLTGQKKLLKR